MKEYSISLKHILVSLIGVCALCCCGPKDADTAEASALAFAADYYSWHLNRCMSRVTAESEPSLRFLAATITAADIDTLHHAQQDPEVSLLRCEQISDTTAMVTIAVSNVYLADSIGQPLLFHDRIERTVNMIRRNGRWVADVRKEF